jgi:hypothetical protein
MHSRADVRDDLAMDRPLRDAGEIAISEPTLRNDPAASPDVCATPSRVQASVRSRATHIPPPDEDQETRRLVTRVLLSRQGGRLGEGSFLGRPGSSHGQRADQHVPTDRGAIGFAVLTAVASGRTDSVVGEVGPAVALNEGFQLALLVAAGIVVVAVALTAIVDADHVGPRPSVAPRPARSPRGGGPM